MGILVEARFTGAAKLFDPIFDPLAPTSTWGFLAKRGYSVDQE